MKKTKQNGFTLILVIVALVLIATCMFVLAGDSNTILLQTNTAYLQACRQNLTASGLAWAEKNIESQQNYNKVIELDIAEMNMPRSALSVTIDSPGEKGLQAQINTRCSRGRQALSHEGKYRLNSVYVLKSAF